MYCSIQEAFENSMPPAPKKPKRSKRPIEPFLTDPDRPANIPAAPVEKVGGGSNSYSNLLSAIDADQSYFPHPSEDAPQEKAYMLEPDWTKQFDGPSVPPWIKERIAAKDAEIPLKPPTWMDGEATLWQKIPAAYMPPPPTPAPAAAPIYPDLDERFHQFESKIESKLDQMFAKLNELDARKSESNHIEIILFIIGGLFVILMLDILVKQGTKASMMLAAVGGKSVGGAALRGLF
jgi:hypothetical protein